MPGSSVPGWVRSAAGGDAISAEPLPWGFRNETWLVGLPGGRRVVATRYVDPTVGLRLRTLLPAIGPRMAAAGLPIPAVIDDAPGTGLPRSELTEGIIVTEYLDGVAAAGLLGQPGGPALIGSLAGAAWRRLSMVSADGLGLPDLWASPDRLATAVRQWTDHLGSTVSRADHVRLATRSEPLAELLRGRPSMVVHGDFVPVNILVRGGTFVGLVDLESVRLGDPLIDAAWFDWIVYYHHRAEERAVWSAFEVASGVDAQDPTTASLLKLLPLVQILEILNNEELTKSGRERWLEHLTACLDRSAGTDA